MKRKLAFLLLTFLVLASCGPKPQYKTREGKKKQKYYNMQQYDRHDRDEKAIKQMKK
jgi:hypothetical protein